MTPDTAVGEAPGAGSADELRKARIMAAAKEIFVRQGYHETSLAAIASEAHVALVSLYKAFGDKDGLFREAICEIESEYAAISLEIGGDDTLFSTLSRTADILQEIALRPRSTELMLFLVGESKHFPDLTQRSVKENFTRLCGSLEEVFERLAAAGIAATICPARLALLFVDTVLGMRPLFAHFSVPFLPPSAADRDERVELFIRGAFGEAAALAARTRKLKPEAAPTGNRSDKQERKEGDAT